MFCSTIIATIGRPTLMRAVNSVLNQDFAVDEYEVIIVNDSGRPLPGMDWQGSRRVRVMNTNRHERSVARNIGAATAKGKYLHFLDDDDWLSHDALRNLWQLTKKTNAGWYYGSSQLIDRQGGTLIQLHHKLNGNCFIQVLAGEWIPLQASLIDSKIFFSVGGFNPLISGPEDIDLLRRIALHSDIAGTSEIVVCIERGEEGSSTDYSRHAEISRLARELIIDENEAFTRMRLSSKTNYWHGRIVRVYLTSMVWNIQHKRLMTAASRTAFGLAGVALAGKSVFRTEFWRAVSRPYKSDTFARGFHEVKQASV